MAVPAEVRIRWREVFELIQRAEHDDIVLDYGDAIQSSASSAVVGMARSPVLRPYLFPRRRRQTRLLVFDAPPD